MSSSNSNYNSFESPNNGSSSFLESNNLFSKFAFLLVLLLVFIFLFRVGVSFISWIFNPSPSPHLINGIVDASLAKTIFQQPGNNSIPIYRSVNERSGIEFTWSFWVNIKDINYDKATYSTIFYKGNNNVSDDGLNYPNNAPGFYLKPKSNDLVIIMNTFTVINEEIEVPGIPLNKWVNIMLRCQNTKLDVYINGTITRSLELSDVPKQNYGNVYIGANGGFNGYISDLWYFDHSLGPGEISSLVRKGPNLKMNGSDSNDLSISMPDFLSLRWYFYGDDV
jgi:hypothetical protein